MAMETSQNNILIKELTRVLEMVRIDIKEFTDEDGNDGGCSYICPKSAFTKDPTSNAGITRTWFKSQRPSINLHPQFYEGREYAYVWFKSDHTRVEFLLYLIEILTEGVVGTQPTSVT
jgi:hypothetical protein